jgi:superfamily II DNA/RNA helicase
VELLADLPLPAWLTERAQSLGFSQPTPVQAAAVGPIVQGSDAIVLAQTGSGKTLAYLLPILARVRPVSSAQALVLVPSRELAAQVARVARRLAAGSPERLLVMALLDGSGARRQRLWIKAQPPQARLRSPFGTNVPNCTPAGCHPSPAPLPQVIIGNVQQVDSIVSAGLLDPGSLQILIVDEVDACLADVDSRAAVERILCARTGGGGGLRQTIFVSASLPQRNHFRRQAVQQRWCNSEPVLIHAQAEEPMPVQLRHVVAVCAPRKRVAALRVLLRRDAPDVTAAIVFVRRDRPLDKIAAALAGIVGEAGDVPHVLSEELPLNARARAMAGLRDGTRRVMVTTPMAARGLDIPDCSHVYLFDLPDTAEAYLHAAGRSGRIGRPGRVTVLCAEQERFVLRRFGNALGVDFEEAGVGRRSEGD